MKLKIYTDCTECNKHLLFNSITTNADRTISFVCPFCKSSVTKDGYGHVDLEVNPEVIDEMNTYNDALDGIPGNETILMYMSGLMGLIEYREAMSSSK